MMLLNVFDHFLFGRVNHIPKLQLFFLIISEKLLEHLKWNKFAEGMHAKAMTAFLFQTVWGSLTAFVFDADSLNQVA